MSDTMIPTRVLGRQGLIAFAGRYQSTPQHLQTRVAMWCGYATASEVASIDGYPLAGLNCSHRAGIQ